MATYINFPPHLAFSFGILGNIISILVYLAPVPTFIRICKNKSTEDFQSLPYLVALFSSSLWLYYAMIKHNALLLISINSIGCVIEIIYIFLFCIYASREKRVATIKFVLLMNVLLFFSIVVLAEFIVHAAPLRISIVGWICVAVSVSVFAAPLTILRQVIRTRSVEFMPFPLSFFLTLSAVMWFCYGLFLNDICVALPNVLGFLLGIIQMGLYAYFRSRSCTLPQVKKPADDNLKSIVILSTLGAAEVYPVEVLLDADQVGRPQDEASNVWTPNETRILGP